MPFSIDSEGKIQTVKKTGQNVLDDIKKEKLVFIDLHFTDVPGRLQHTTVPARTIDAASFEDGIPKLDGSSIKGFTSISESDMLLKPDPSSFVVIPWSNEDHKYARLFCDVFWGFGQGRLSRDPRGVAQGAEAHLKSFGFDVSYWGPELEFFVFDNATWDTSSPYKGQSYSVQSEEAAWSPTGTSYPIRFKEGYFPAPPQDTLMDLRNEIVKLFEQNFGILCDAHHHEVSTAGQGEINMRYDSLTSMADNVQTFKYVVKNVVHQRGKIATFMPKPIFMDNASGMHTHQSLWKDGKNTFYDPDDKHAELSQTGRYYGGGLMEHSKALACIIAPTTNSYKRLVPGFEAPVYIAWSRRNRSANVRVPVYEKGPASSAAKRLEFRCPDPTANPYFAFSAMLAAGLDGIKKKVDIGNPVDENIYLLSPERRRELGIKELPKDLGEAAAELESDQEFLKPIFGADIVEMMIETARTQHLEVTMRPHPHEFYMYFDA